MPHTVIVAIVILFLNKTLSQASNKLHVKLVRQNFAIICQIIVIPRTNQKMTNNRLIKICGWDILVKKGVHWIIVDYTVIADFRICGPGLTASSLVKFNETTASSPFSSLYDLKAGSLKPTTHCLRRTMKHDENPKTYTICYLSIVFAQIVCVKIPFESSPKNRLPVQTRRTGFRKETFHKTPSIIFYAPCMLRTNFVGSLCWLQTVCSRHKVSCTLFTKNDETEMKQKKISKKTMLHTICFSSIVVAINELPLFVWNSLWFRLKSVTHYSRTNNKTPTKLQNWYENTNRVYSMFAAFNKRGFCCVHLVEQFLDKHKGDFPQQ